MGRVFSEGSRKYQMDDERSSIVYIIKWEVYHVGRVLFKPSQRHREYLDSLYTLRSLCIYNTLHNTHLPSSALRHYQQ